MSYPQQQQRLSGHPPVSHRLTELLEAIKQEFVSVSSEASAYLMHKDEFDHKLLTQHVNDLQQVRKTIYELDMAHRKMKDQYEEEILHLKRQIEGQRAGAPPLPAPAHTSAGRPHPHAPGQQGLGVGLPTNARSSNASAPGLPGPGAPGAPAGPTGSESYGAPETKAEYDRYYASGGPGNALRPGAPASSGAQGQPGANSQGVVSQTASPMVPGSAQGGPGTTAGPVQPPTAPGVSPSTGPAAAPGKSPQSNWNGATSSHASVNSVSGSAQSGGPSSQQPSGQQTPQAAVPSQQLSNGNPPAQSNGAVHPSTGVEDEAMIQAQQLGNNLASLDLDHIAPELIKHKDDWVVVHNERAPKQIDVDIVHSLEHTSVVCCVRFSQDGKYLATGCNHSAQIYDVQTGQLLCWLQDDSVGSDEDLYIRSVCFSPDATLLATGAEDHQIRVWDIATQKIRYLFTGHEQDIYSLDISRNGRHIASGSGDGTVRIWDMESGQCVLTLSIEEGVTAVSISPDGRFVAAGSLDDIVRVWDTQTGFLVERLEAPDGHKDSVYSVAFTPDGLDLVSGSLDKSIKLWELQAPRGNQSTHKGGVCKRTIMGHKDFVLSVATTPDGNWILSGSKDRGVQFWDPRTGQAQLMLQAHINSVISVAPSPVGGLFATGSGDHWAKIWRYYPV